MDAREFYDLCAAHDWFHSMADDEKDHKKGADERSKLLSIIAAYPCHDAMFRKWAAHVSFRAPRPMFQQVGVAI